MKKVFDAPVKLWHFALGIVAVAALTSTMVASASPLPGFLTKGTVMMAWANNPNGFTVPSGYTSKNVLQQTIVVPAGKHADLAVFGEVDVQGGALTGNMYCFGQYRLDNITTGAQFKPGNTILIGFNPPQNNLSVPINGMLGNVGAGSHTIYMVMQAGYADCIAQYRQMVIIANVH